MGKAKKKKFRPPKKEPTGLPSVKEFESELENGAHNEETHTNSTVAGVVEELQSVNAETRECGCTTLANLVNQSSAIPILLQNNIVKIVAPLIVDDNPHIRHVALGALRNLSVSGGHEVCEEMIQKDVLTPLVTLFHKYGCGWQREKTEKAAKHSDSLEDIFREAVHLLWNLCESSDLAVSVFNKENVIQILLPCLQAEVYGFNTAIVVAHCLHTVTENNKMAAMFCQSGDVMTLLQKLILPSETAESILLSTLVTGILINISDMSTKQLPTALVMETVVKVLSVEVASLLGEATQNGCQMESDTGEEESSNTDKANRKESEPRGKLKEVQDILTAQRTSLEIIANMCSAVDDDWEDIHSSESGSSEDLMMDEVMEEEVSQEFTPLCVPNEIHDSLMNHDVLSKVLSKAQPLEEDRELVLNNCVGGHKVLKSLLRVQNHALLCINNMVNSMSAEYLGGLPELHKMWERLVLLSTSQQAKAHLDLLEAVTSAMRATMQKLAELESPKFSEISGADLQFLFTMIQQCDNCRVRVNAVRCIATVGALLAKIQTPHPLLKDIGTILVEVAAHDSDLWVVAEALDSVFDVFSEDHVAPVIHSAGLVDKLRNILPLLKSRINSQRGQLGEHYPVITTARTNLVRFIKYQETLKHTLVNNQ